MTLVQDDARRYISEAEITKRGQAERAASASDRFLVSIRSLTVAARQDEPFLRLTSLCNFRLTDLGLHVFILSG